MIVKNISEIKGTGREVCCPNDGFISNRFLLQSDGMGFGFHKTVIPENKTETWHYKNHLEACYCISGKALLLNNETGEYFNIIPDTMYALDKNEKHTLMTIEETVLLCVFNPPLSGAETHQKDGSYVLTKGE